MIGLRALTVKQPWAWALIYGGKDVENRSWGTIHRGPLAIHAGKRFDRDGEDDVNVQRAKARALSLDGLYRYGMMGAFIGVVELQSVHEAGTLGCKPDTPCSPWAQFSPDRTTFHWRVALAQPLPEPLPANGSLGLWFPREPACGLLTDFLAGVW